MTMKPLWYLQKNCLSDLDVNGMTEAITSSGYSYKSFYIIPFSDYKIEDVEHDGPIIPYGGTRIIEKIRLTKKWTVWFNEDFTYRKALENYGQYMFNSDAKCMKLKEFNPSDYETGECLFIRPDKDLKEFNGEVITPQEYIYWHNKINWFNKVNGNGVDIGEETDIVVAKASRIDREWRTFIVDSKFIGGSQYKKDGRLSIDPYVHQEVIDFAEKMAKIWKPSEVFVMDICKLNDELSILEIGDFHSAGWYHTDKHAVIKAVSEYAEKNYKGESK